MPSTYTVNLGIEKPATGEQSGTWGDTVNDNSNLLDEAINGAVEIVLAAAGSSGTPNQIAITDGTSSTGRNKWIQFGDGGDLGASVYVQLIPNDAEKICFIRNSLSGSRSIFLFQGTYNASNDLEIAAGTDVAVKFNGGGTGATVVNVYANLKVDGIVATTADINGGTIDATTLGATTRAAGSFTTLDANSTLGVTGATTLSDTLGVTGAATLSDTLGVTGATTLSDTLGVTGAATLSSTLGVTGLATLATVDINGGTIDGTVIGGASAAALTATTVVANTSVNIAGDGATVTGIKDEDNMASNSATKLATQQSIKAYVDAQVGSYDSLAEVLAVGNITGGTDLDLSIGDDLTTLTAGTSNFRAGVNAGSSIAVGGNYNTVVGDEAGAATTTGANNVAVGYGALQSNTTGGTNTASGKGALNANTTGSNNTASGASALQANTTGNYNTASGASALQANTTGNYNTASGYSALNANTTGSENTASGANALQNNTTGAQNTASGSAALYANTTGNYNTASGRYALQANTTGTNNTSSGRNSLYANTTGSYNTASGQGALFNNTTASSNTASGFQALYYNTTGTQNTASGVSALQANTTGNNNTASGVSALQANTTGNYNTAFGFQNYDNLTTGDYNVALGYNLNASAVGVSSEIAVGVGFTGGGANTVRIGTAGGTATLGLDGSDTSWAAASDARLKKDIVDSTVGLSFINALRPVTFKWNSKDAIDKTLPQYDSDSSEPVFGEGKAHHGFIAQEVKSVIDSNPDVVNGHNIWHQSPDGTQQVAPSALVPMLVKAIQELTARIKLLEG